MTFEVHREHVVSVRGGDETRDAFLVDFTGPPVKCDGILTDVGVKAVGDGLDNAEAPGLRLFYNKCYSAASAGLRKVRDARGL